MVPTMNKISWAREVSDGSMTSFGPFGPINGNGLGTNITATDLAESSEKKMNFFMESGKLCDIFLI